MTQTINLMQSKIAEDATDAPEEIRQSEAELTEFKRNMNHRQKLLDMALTWIGYVFGFLLYDLFKRIAWHRNINWWDDLMRANFTAIFVYFVFMFINKQIKRTKNPDL